jgi:hypothetical protein
MRPTKLEATKVCNDCATASLVLFFLCTHVLFDLSKITGNGERMRFCSTSVIDFTIFQQNAPSYLIKVTLRVLFDYTPAEDGS